MIARMGTIRTRRLSNRNRGWRLSAVFALVGGLLVSTAPVASAQGAPLNQAATETLGTTRARPVATAHPMRLRDLGVASASDANRSAGEASAFDPDPEAVRVARTRVRSRTAAVTVRAEAGATVSPTDASDAGSHKSLAPPTVSTGYQTATLATGTPPDTQLAVGPNHVLVAQNGSVTVHDKSTNAIATSATLAGFWTGTVAFTRVFDPRVRFDPTMSRFILVTLTDSRLPTSNILVAVSATDDPTGLWNRYAFLTDSAGGLWADYPQIGFSSDKIAIGFNTFTVATSSVFDAPNVLVLEKAALVSGGVAAGNTQISDQLDFSPAPSANVDPNQSDIWIVAAWDGMDDRLAVVRLSGPVSAPVFGIKIAVVGDPWTFGQSPFVVPQTGGSIGIRSADDRIETVTQRNGRIYATHQVFVGSPLRSVVQWWVFDPAGLRSQYGRLDSGTSDIQYAFPSVAVNKRGDLSFAYARFSNDSFPSTATAFHAFDDGPGVISAFQTVKPGEAFYTGPVFVPPQQRWGDYTGSAVDPSDDITFWHAAEYSGAAGAQANWVWKAQPAPLPPAQGYVALEPARVLDTRSDSTVNGTGKPVPGLTEIEVVVAGRGGVPATATAVAVNVTVTGPTASGFLAVYPGGTPRPNASNLNFGTNQNVANLVVTRLGSNGSVRVYTSATTHVIFDVQGYFDPVSTMRYHPIAPVRAMDTRPASLIGSVAGPIPANGFTDVQVTGTFGIPTTGVSAVVLNVTATGGSRSGYVTAHPSDAAAPNASNLNFTTADAANLVYAKVSADGRVRLGVKDSAVHLIADVEGWYGADTLNTNGLTTVVSPTRILDTRSAVGVATAGRAAAGQEIELRFTTGAGVPLTTSAVLLNITATGPIASGYATVYPSGTGRPNASNLNFGTNRDVANLVAVPIGADGRVRLYVSASTHLVADLEGWVTIS